MIHPVYLLGRSELRETTQPVESDSQELQSLIDDMIETMHAASGIGLAAPQIGRTERLFVVDVSPMRESLEEEGVDVPEQPMVFLNAAIVLDSEEESEFEEGCLSIPDIHEVVVRPETIRIRYLGRDFEEREEEFSGMLARVIQHEYDHVEGILFIDHLSPLRRRLLKRRLADIRSGNVETDYEVLPA
jgi:peptide deformylase